MLFNPVITSASWALAQGDPTRVPKESMIRHRPLAEEQRAIFEYDFRFEAMAGNLVRALQALASLPKSKWSARPLARGEAAREAAAGGVVLLSGSDGIQALRAFVQQQRRTRNCSDGGSRAWSNRWSECATLEWGFGETQRHSNMLGAQCFHFARGMLFLWVSQHHSKIYIIIM